MLVDASSQARATRPIICCLGQAPCLAYSAATASASAKPLRVRSDSPTPTHMLVLSSFRRILITGITYFTLATAAVAAVPAPYVLGNTEVVAISASRLSREYEIYVSLPIEYAKPTKRYPVVYVTDASYAFPLARAIAGRIDQHGVGLGKFILVGLSYAKGESGAASRNRDYTPPRTVLGTARRRRIPTVKERRT